MVVHNTRLMRRLTSVSVFAAAIAVVLLLSSAGCRRRPDTTAEDNGAPGAGAGGAAAPATIEPPGGGLTGMTKPVMNLLADERAARPGGTPTAEAVFEAMKKAGVPTSGESQVLGKTLGAAFCENARTAQGTVLSVCEFKDAATLAKGMEYSTKTFAKALPNRRLFANRSTLLTVNPSENSDSAHAELKTIERTFGGL